MSARSSLRAANLFLSVGLLGARMLMKVGAWCEARYLAQQLGTARTQWHPAIIKKVHADESADVEYSQDGIIEKKMPPEFLRPLKSEEKSTPKKATEKSTPKNAAKEKRPREDTPSPKTASKDDASAIGVGQKLSVCWRPMPKGDLQVLLHSQTPKGKLQWYDAEVTATDGEGGSVTLYYALDDTTFDGQMLHGDGRIVYKLVEPAEPKTAAPKKVTKAKETRPREDTPSPTPVDAPTDFSGPEYAHLSDYEKQRLATMEENARALRAFGIDDDLASMRTAPKELSEEERLARNERRLERLAELQANKRPTSTRVQTLEKQRGAREKEQRKRLAEEHAFFEATERALADADGDRPRKAAKRGGGGRGRKAAAPPALTDAQRASLAAAEGWIEPMRKWFAPQLSEATLRAMASRIDVRPACGPKKVTIVSAGRTSAPEAARGCQKAHRVQRRKLATRQAASGLACPRADVHLSPSVTWSVSAVHVVAESRSYIRPSTLSAVALARQIRRVSVTLGE